MGSSSQTRKITNVASGGDVNSTAHDTDAVNYGQVRGTYKDATYSNSKLTLTKVDGTTTELTITGGGSGGGVTNFKADNSTSATSVDSSHSTTIAGGTTASTSVTQTKNISTSISADTDGNATIDVKLAPDLTVDSITTNSVTTSSMTVGTDTSQTVIGDSGISFCGNTYISSSGLNANNKAITNVASAGTLSDTNTNAANATDVYKATTMASAGQYYAANDRVTTAVGNLDTQVKTLSATGISADKVTQIETNKTDIATNTNSIATLTGDASTAGSVANTASKYSAVTVNGSNVNTGSGVEFVAGDNVQLSVEQGTNKIKITSTSGTDTAAVHYDMEGGTKTNSVTFYDKDGKTQATGGSVVTLKNAQLEISGTESGGSSTKVEHGSITVSGGTSESAVATAINKEGITVSGGTGTTTTTTIINEKGIYTGSEGVKYVEVKNTVAENLLVIDKQVTMINADKTNVDFDTESAKASGSKSTAVGYNTESSGETSTAVGYNNQVSGKNSTAIGTGNVVTGDASGAFGDPSYIYGSGSYSVGNNNTIGSATNANLGKDTFVLGSNITTTANNSVVLGANSTAAEDNVVSVGSEGNERRITNVAAGTKATDAVNYGQFSSLSTQINQSYNYLNNEIGRVGALSAALAGLHPLYTPGVKGQFAMAFGGYGGKQAIAAGGFYAPNDRAMFSAGIGFSEGGSKMGNVGVTFAFDAQKRSAVSRMTSEEINAMLTKVEEQNKALKAQNEALKKDGGDNTTKIVTLQQKLTQQENENKKLSSTVDLLLKEVQALKAKIK